ncbi:glycosyltransferase family 4 protein [Nocardioides conyzicola]|uniref:glycosyltransferase family 4 protein n=1 Tax=Nocardioides conyzicola TaxID=1651781 RepID=UPI0031EE2695
MASGIHDRTPNRVSLVGTSGALVDEWRRALPDCPAETVRLPPRFLRELSLVLAAWRRAPRGSALVLFEFRLIVTLPLLVMLARVKGMRVVVDVHDSPEESSRRALIAQLLRLVDSAVCVSSYIAEQLPTTRTHVVFRPMDTASPAERTVDLDRIVVGVIGQIARHKRVEAAFKLISAGENRMSCVVRGASSGVDGENYLAEVNAAAVEIGGRRAMVEPAVEPAHALDGIDVLFAGNPMEPSSRAVAEAQMRGIPAVVPDRGGAQEFIKDRVTGFVYPVDDPGSIATDLLGMSSQDWETMSRRARAWAASEFDRDSQVAKYVNAVWARASD